MNKNFEENDDWNEYSKLVLSELGRLKENDEKIQQTLESINLKLGRIDSVEKEIEILQKWKRYMDDVASPTTLKELKKDVVSLNTFKTVATTVWAVVQIAFGVFIALFWNK